MAQQLIALTVLSDTQALVPRYQQETVNTCLFIAPIPVVLSSGLSRHLHAYKLT